MEMQWLKMVCLAMLPFFVGGHLWAQSIESRGTAVGNNEAAPGGNEEIIFSNLSRGSSTLFNLNEENIVAGKRAGVQTETWDAIAFTPTADYDANVLFAAIGYVSGTKLVKLGIYRDNGSGTVGKVLPGGEGSTAQIPDAGVGYQLVKVVLGGSGASLSAGTRYWLVARPDNSNAPTFSGVWQLSNLGANAGRVIPPDYWQYNPGQWNAGEVRGTKKQGSNRPTGTKPNLDPTSVPLIGNKVTLFSNLGPSRADLFCFGCGGLPIQGNGVPTGIEVWEALPFSPKADSHATTLRAAIGYVAGASEVNLGIYSDNGGTVGTLLPNGQGSTTEIPAIGTCCSLATVTLPVTGAQLSAGTQYWLVASPNDLDASTFQGAWQDSNRSFSAYKEPQQFINWTTINGDWLAAEIQGTTP